MLCFYTVMFKKIIIFIFCTFFCLSSSLSAKEYIKEKKKIIPTDKTLNEVVNSIVEELKNEAVQEAGIFISSESKIEGGNITKEKTTVISGAVTKTKILEQIPYIQGNGQYVKVKVKINIDDKQLKNYLKKVKKDETHKKKAEEANKKVAKLEKQLQEASKIQYERKISNEAQMVVDYRQKEDAKLEKASQKAKKEYERIQKQQREINSLRREKLNDFQLKTQKENEERMRELELQIAQIKKNKEENDLKIKQLETTTKINNFTIPNSNITIQNALHEANKILKEIERIKKQYRKSFAKNKEEIISNYNKTINTAKNSRFLAIKPKKEMSLNY